MASLVAESSEGSLPQSAIAQYQAAFLQQGRVWSGAKGGEARDGEMENDDFGADATGDDDGMATDGAGNNGVDEVVIAREGTKVGAGDAVVERSAQAYRTPVSSPKTNDALKPPPRLESAKSAPPADMGDMVNESPLPVAEEVTRVKRLDRDDYGGDTQPLSEEVYAEYHQSVAMSKSMKAQTPKKEKVVLEISPRMENTYDTQGTGEAPRTLEKGMPGFVDFDVELDSDTGSPRPESELGDSINGESQPEQLQGYDDGFRRPDLPETPAAAGQKRKRSGVVPTSEPSTKKTAAVFDAFGFGKATTMTATQLWEQQTQMRSSPIADANWSNAARTRPSPNITNQFTASSPMLAQSSPIFQRAPPSTAGEPRVKYITAKESQERKTRQLEKDYNLPPRGDTQDDEEDTQEWRMKQQRLKRNMSDQNLRDLGALSAHSRPRSRPATSSSPLKPPIIDLRTPALARQVTEEDFNSTAGDRSENDGEDEEPIVEDEHMDDAQDEDQECVNDVYDELAQNVIRSQGAESEDNEVEDDEGEEEDAVDEGQIAEIGVEEAEEPGPPKTLVHGSSQLGCTDFQRKSQTGTQHSAIPDSQTVRSQRQQPSGSQLGNENSPTCSHVRGSQYVGKTSQDQTSVPARRTNVPMGPPTLSASRSDEAAQQVVPSSPPLAATNGTSDNYTADASWERRQILEQFQPAQQDEEPEIPESDVRGPDHDSSRPATAEDRPNTESNNATFSTARSHLSASGPSRSQGAPTASQTRALASQQSTVNSQSPRTKAGVRRFAELAGPASAPVGSAEEAIADLDAVMSDFITAEDQQVLDATSDAAPEPRPKRRRGVGKATVRSSSPVKESQVRKGGDSNHSMQTNGGDADDLKTRALRNSPSRANEQRIASPSGKFTPDSVKQREHAGARAASQLVAKRSSNVAKPARLSSTARKTGSRLQHETTAQDDDATPKRARKSRRTSAQTDVQPVEEPAVTETEPSNTEEPEIEETVVETHEGDESAERDGQAEDIAIAAPLRVFALFKGNFNAFYPATWLGVSNNGGHRIKFDDTTVTSVEPHLAARLELTLGDQVKIDRPGMKNKVWIVKGFGPALLSDKAQLAYTDVHGHEIVKVQAKSTRNSISGSNALVQGEGEVVQMPVEVVYLTHSLWQHFSRLEFRPGVQHGVTSRLETPSTGAQTPLNAETPPSRSRRTTNSTVKALEKRGSSLRDESAAAVTTPNAGLFSGMAFAVSYGPNENERANLTRHIQRNGGTILEDGFTSLFEIPNLEDADGAANASRLQLRLEHRALGFVALIADKHSRREKYIQALALGIPTLSGRWITHSLDAWKNSSLRSARSAPLAWTKYLLAAGESSYLGGAIRSRDLPGYPAESARLEDTVANRPRILDGEGVLIVGSKKSKAVWERRKAFAFLTVALGAGHVRRVGDLLEAKGLVAEEEADGGERWRFVYVDGSVAEASNVLFGNKKRKRDGPGGGKAVSAMSASDGRVRVVNDEFVIQSMILGALVD